jgi:hypothetical protein
MTDSQPLTGDELAAIKARAAHANWGGTGYLPDAIAPAEVLGLVAEVERLRAPAIAPSSEEVRARLHAAREAKGKGLVDCWACEAYEEVIALLYEMHQAGWEQGRAEAGAGIDYGLTGDEIAAIRASR